MKTKIFLLSGAVAIMIAACTSSSQKQAAPDNLQEFTEKLHDIVPSLAKPSQAVPIFQLAGVEYNKSLVLDPQKWEAYTKDSMLCAANIGVYLADAFYEFATENKGNNYMREGMYMSIAAATSLAKSVGMGDQFTLALIDRYEENKINADSTITLIDDAFKASNVKASETATMRFFMAMAIGNFIEKEYILFHSAMENPNNLPDEARLLLGRQMFIILKHQLEVSGQLATLAESLKNESDSGKLIEMMKNLHATYSSIDFSMEKVNAMTPEQFFNNPKLLETYHAVNEIRSFITQQ